MKKFYHALCIMKSLSFDTVLWCLSVIGGTILLCFSFFTSPVDRQAFKAHVATADISEGDRIIEYSSIFGNINLDAINDISELYEYIPEEVSSDVEGFSSVEEAIIASGVLEAEDAEVGIKIVDSFSRVATSTSGDKDLLKDSEAAVNITAEEDFDVANEYTYDEVELLGRLVQCEAESEDLQGKILIANVVLNRIEDGQWGSSITEVVLSPGQFEPVTNGAIKISNVDASTKEAVLIALSGQNNSQGALYFQKSNKAWTGREYLFTYGAHSFYK